MVDSKLEFDLQDEENEDKIQINSPNNSRIMQSKNMITLKNTLMNDDDINKYQGTKHIYSNNNSKFISKLNNDTMVNLGNNNMQRNKINFNENDDNAGRDILLNDNKLSFIKGYYNNEIHCDKELNIPNEDNIIIEDLCDIEKKKINRDAYENDNDYINVNNKQALIATVTRIKPKLNTKFANLHLDLDQLDQQKKMFSNSFGGGIGMNYGNSSSDNASGGGGGGGGGSVRGGSRNHNANTNTNANDKNYDINNHIHPGSGNSYGNVNNLTNANGNSDAANGTAYAIGSNNNPSFKKFNNECMVNYALTPKSQQQQLQQQQQPPQYQQQSQYPQQPQHQHQPNIPSISLNSIPLMGYIDITNKYDSNDIATKEGGYSGGGGSSGRGIHDKKDINNNGKLFYSPRYNNNNVSKMNININNVNPNSNSNSNPNSKNSNISNKPNNSTKTPRNEYIPKIISIDFENIIQNMIESADDDSIINLPDEHIKISALYLKKNITIKGSPGTILEITDTSIFIENDILQPKYSPIKVLFCECTIQYDFNKQKFMDNINTRSDSNSRRNMHKEFEDSFKSTDKKNVLNSNSSDQNSISSRIYTQENNFVLFSIKSAATLEIRDCQITSLVKKSFVGTEEYKYLNDVQDTAIFIQTSTISKTTSKYPSVILKSTTINGFACIISADANATLNIQKCHFSDTRGHSINLLSPKNFKMIESTIENSEKSGINIRLSKEAFDDSAKHITINENEIKHCGSYGISIYGENMRYQKFDLKIQKNKIFQGKKDAIGFKLLNFCSIQVCENDLRQNKGNGLFMQFINDTVNNSQAYILGNIINFNEKNGIQIKESHVMLENNHIFNNGMNGIHMAYSEDITQDETTYYINHIIRAIINTCKIHGNHEAGISITGLLKGPIILNCCVINENNQGLLINEKNWSSCIEPMTFQNLLTSSNSNIDDQIRSPKSLTPRTQNIKLIDLNKVVTTPTNNNSKLIYNSNKIQWILTPIAIQKCEITNNINSGLFFKKLYSQCYITETIITNNKNYAIYLESIQDKDFIKLKDLDNIKMKDYIQGHIGGPFGLLYDTNKQIGCKGNHNCSVF